MTAPTDALQQVLDRLPGHKGNGDKWTAFCPCHENPPTGHKPSLSIARGDGGRVLLNCLGGCATADVVEALGLEMTDLFADAPPHVKHRTRARTSVTAGAATPSFAPTRQFVTAYPYHGACGHLLFETCRYVPKDFRQRRPDGTGGYVWNLDDVPRVLYRLPELLAADPAAWVFACGGEKDADAVAALGCVATCNPCGEGHWGRLISDSALHGRRLCIVVHKDVVGRKHAQDVGRRLHGKATEIRLLELPDAITGAVNDAADWVEAHDGQDNEELAALLLALAEKAPRYSPPAEAEPQDAPDDTETDSQAVLVVLANVTPERLCYLWPARIPLGKVTLFFGDPGVAKSLLTLDMAARVSRGMPWPDLPGERTTPGGVVLLSAEDDPADTIVPRLMAAGADLRRIVVLQAVKHINGSSAYFNLTQDMPALEDAIRRTPDCCFVVIDPITAYLGGTDGHKNADIRGLLAPLAGLAARYGVAILCVTHMNKGAAGRALYRAMGSLAFIAAARAAWLIVEDDKDPLRRLMLPAKMNLAKHPNGLAYRINERLVDSIGPVGYVDWEKEPVLMTADTALAAAAADPEHRTALDTAAEWLRTVLAAGPMTAKAIQDESKSAGMAWPTVRRAQDMAGAKTRKQGFGAEGAWYWFLPDDVAKALNTQP
jgi:hypothetical protein